MPGPMLPGANDSGPARLFLIRSAACSPGMRERVRRAVGSGIFMPGERGSGNGGPVPMRRPACYSSALRAPDLPKEQLA